MREWRTIDFRATAVLALCLLFMPSALAQDPDGDGVPLLQDNCPNDANPLQEDIDYDGRGDICDNCFDRYNPNQANEDGDAFGNVCDATPGTNDWDADGFVNSNDNCPLLTNEGQGDVDNDGIGDACDTDLRFMSLISFNDTTDRLPVVDGMIVPPRFFGTNGELRVSITGTHQLVENAVTGNLGSLPEDRSPADFRFTVSGGTVRPLAELRNNPPLGPQLVFNTSNYLITVPQQLRGEARAGDAVLQLTLTIEVTRDQGATYNLVDFTSASLIDGRDIEQEANQPISDRPLSLQLTTPAIEKLGLTLASSQPYPDIESFNAALQNDVPLIDGAKSVRASDPVCFSLNSMPEFKDLPSWPTIRDEARALYASYQALEATACSDANQSAACAGTAVAVGTGAVLAGPAGAVAAALATAGPAAHCAACEAMERWCTKDSYPVDDDFEVCFEEFGGKLVSQTVGELTDMQITVSEDRNNQLDVDVSMADIDTRVDIGFSDFFIRYTEGRNGCILRPVQAVPQSEINSNEVLSGELSCPNAQVFARRACTTCAPDFPPFPGPQSFPEPFSLAISQADPEKFVAVDLGEANLLLQDLQANLPGNTVCTDPNASQSLVSGAQALLESYYQEAFNLLNFTWERDRSDKTKADNLTDLFSPLHTGLPDSDYARDDLQFIDLSLDADDGLIVQQSVNVESGPLSAMPPASTLYKGFELGGAIYRGGTSPLGDFDVQQTLSLAYLNRRIAAQYLDTMAITINPSWEDLGLAPPPGVAATQPVPMTGDVLGQWNPVFLALGGLTLEFTARVPVLPFTWMEPDYITPVAPIHYEVPRVLMTVTGEKGELYAKLAGLYEGSVALNLSGEDFNNNADGFTVGSWQFGVVDSLDFPNCNFKDVLEEGPCAASFVSSMESVFEPVFDEAFNEFFGVLRSPAFFNQATDALIPALAEPLAPQNSLAADGHSSQFGRLAYSLGPDSDSDGVPDLQDNCPETANPNQLDADGDGAGDICDDDDDNDGFDDKDDLCPVTPSSQSDSDDDGVGDECDDDLDGDGVLNVVDNCAGVFNQGQDDQDKDGEGDACDVDKDNDGFSDDDDNCVSVSNRDQLDNDGDGFGDACDTDLDGDDVNNEADNCPEVSNPQQLDFDLDRTGNACDLDYDNDGTFDEEDNCPTVWNFDQADSDGDGVGDFCEDPTTLDSDGDGIPDAEDAFPFSPVAFLDSDGDGLPDQVNPRCGAGCLMAMGLSEDQDDDDDGYSDAEELGFGTDALNPDDFPVSSGVSPTIIHAIRCRQRPNSRACR